MAHRDSTTPIKRQGSSTPPPPLPRRRVPAATPAPQYADDGDDDAATVIDAPPKKWFDHVETIPFDPSMQLLGEGTPPHMMKPVRVAAPPPAPPKRRGKVDVAGGHVVPTGDPDAGPVFAVATPDPDGRAAVAILTPYPLPPTPTAPVQRVSWNQLYGAPALPPHVPTAMALPTAAIMPTQVAAPMPMPHTDVPVTPYPVPPWASHAVPQPYAVLPRTATLDEIYGDTDERGLDTIRVVPPDTAAMNLRPSLRKLALPAGGAAIALVAIVSSLVLARNADREGTRAAAPVVMPVAAAAVVPSAPPPAPVAEAKPLWQPRATTPTVEPIVEAAPVEPEIEMAAVAAEKRSSSRRVKRAKQVAAVRAPKPATRVEAAKPARSKLVEAPKAEKKLAKRDPILEEIERPAKTAEVKTGPGKLRVTSSIPTLIYIDGRSTNLMTPKTLNLAPGAHKITLLELKTRKAKTVDVKIESGTLQQLDKQF